MNINKNVIRKILSSLPVLLLFIGMAYISTCPAFVNNYFKLTMDGQIHFARFESVAQALRSGKLPPNVNFIGLGNVGEAFSSTYPWITALLFIIPRAIMHNPIHAMYIGFLTLNLITIINTYLLTRCLTSRKSLQLLGVAIYQLNTYHFTDLYARNAMGESLAYAFIPLLFMGCYQIWNDQVKGILPLALGMGLVFNSHMITALFAAIILTLIELYRMVSRKFSLRELQRFCFSALLCLPVIAFQIINLIRITLNNHIATTWRGLHPVYALNALKSAINNNITDYPDQYNIGIVCLALLVVMFILSFKKEFQNGAPYIYEAIIILIMTLNWITPSKNISKSIVGNLQFTGRLLSFVVILTVIGSLLILDSMYERINAVTITTIATCLLAVLAYNGVVNYHDTKNDSPIRFYVNKKNFAKTVYKTSCGWGDYSIINDKKKTILKSVLRDDVNFNIKKVSYNGITFCTNLESRNSKIEVPFLMYNSVPYKITVNGHNIDVKTGSTLKLNFKRHENTISIHSDAPKMNYITFSISIISIILMSVATTFYIYKSKQN